MLTNGARSRVVDFLIKTEEGTFVAEVAEDEPLLEAWITACVTDMGHRYRPVGMIELSGGYRLQNAKDLLRYGHCRATLGDRVRLLAALEEMGSLTIAECLSAIREGRPMPTLASLILHGFLEIDLDDALLGPETQVRRIRR